MLHGMFERQQDVSDATANDMKRAYARLLSAANLTGKDPNVCHCTIWHIMMVGMHSYLHPGLVLEISCCLCIVLVYMQTHLCANMCSKNTNKWNERNKRNNYS